MRYTHATALAAAALVTLAACSPDDGSTDAKPPAYKVTEQETSGNQRNITAQVNTTKNLRAVFDDIIDKLDEDAGYFVYINCSTGSTKAWQNRLANGRYARGNIGAATTGLADGDVEFEAVKGATCPDK